MIQRVAWVAAASLLLAGPLSLNPAAGPRGPSRSADYRSMMVRFELDRVDRAVTPSLSRVRLREPARHVIEEAFRYARARGRGERSDRTRWAAARPAGSMSTRRQVGGVIVPHHAPANRQIAQGLLAAVEKGDRVLLLAPNHANVGRHAILSSGASWLTEAGVLPSDSATVAALASSGAVAIDDSAVAGEHGVTTVIPYLAARGAASVVPLIVRSNASIGDVQRLATHLDEHATDLRATVGDRGRARWRSGHATKPTLEAGDAARMAKTVVVAAVDFSHGASGGAAARFDRESLRALADRDAAAFLGWGPEHTDGRTVIPILLELMHRRGYTTWRPGTVSRSDLLGGTWDSDVTSYIVGWYTDS